MSESVVFELKLQIQHLQEKLTFLAGGSNGAELVEVLMEKDEELERNVRTVQYPDLMLRRGTVPSIGGSFICYFQAVCLANPTNHITRTIPQRVVLSSSISSPRGQAVGSDLRSVRYTVAQQCSLPEVGSFEFCHTWGYLRIIEHGVFTVVVLGSLVPLFYS